MARISIRKLAALAAVVTTLCTQAQAGGPRWTAGSVYFNSNVMGKPVIWANGSVVYYTDQGELSSYASNSQAASMVAAAALPWTQVSTASVSITLGGSLNEDVNGSNVSQSGSVTSTVVWPADVESTAKPVAIVYDADGSVINAVYGAGASSASDCLNNVVFSISDGFAATGNLTHAIILLNGLCANNATQLMNMQYLLEREFGRVLGLDWSQVNDNVFTGSPTPKPSDYEGWPLMHPININCGGDNYSCVQNPFALKMDDRAALGHLYPSSSFANSTIRLHGIIKFVGGQGMQGVLVQAIHLVYGTHTPDTSMAASSVTGFSFRGNVGSVVTSTVDAEGLPLARFGSTSSALEGEYDIAGLEALSGAYYSDYELVFTAINPLYTNEHSVGPMLPGSPQPSGTLATIYMHNMYRGWGSEEDETATNSATGPAGLNNTFSTAVPVPLSGEWSSGISGYGDVDWLAISPRPGRQFAIITTAFNEAGIATISKAMPVIGAWFADDAKNSPADFATSQAFNSTAEGVTMLQVVTPTGDGAQFYPMVIAVADARGDGRPDYAYSGRILYADSVSSTVLPASGAIVSILGAGFVAGDYVLINGAPAQLLAWSTQELVVQTPSQAQAGHPAGAVDVQVVDPTGAMAVISGGVSYTAATPDSLNIVDVPGGNTSFSGAVGALAPGTFSVQVVDGNGNPVANAQVAVSDTNGSHLSACSGATSCVVSATSSGIVSTTLLPVNAGLETVTASIANGAYAQAQWTAVSQGERLQFSTLPLEVEPGTAISWPVAVTAISNGVPETSKTITWKVTKGASTLATSSTTTDGNGIASYTVQLPSLAAGAEVVVTACLSDNTCSTVAATATAPLVPVVVPISGTVQTVVASETLAAVVLQIGDGAIPSNPLAGFSATITQQLYSYEPSASGGKEPAPKLLAESTQTVVSNASGLLTVQPLQQSGVAGTVVITVSSGAQTMAVYSLGTTPGIGVSGGGPVPPRKRIAQP